MATYQVIESPKNGTTGQDVGTFALAELPERLRQAVEANQDASEWRLPALSEGDSGEELADLEIVVTAKKRTIQIFGNWRAGGPENEWAGSGTVDKYGAVECSANLGEAAYEAIQEQIADGETEGSVTVHSDEQDRDITYHWSME